MFAAFIPALIGALAVAMASLVGRIIIALGISFVTFTGITIAITSLKTQAIASVNSLPSEVLSFLGFLWIDKAMTIIFSAIVASLAMKSIGGSVKKMVFK